MVKTRKDAGAVLEQLLDYSRNNDGDAVWVRYDEGCFFSVEEARDKVVITFEKDGSIVDSRKRFKSQIVDFIYHNREAVSTFLAPIE